MKKLYSSLIAIVFAIGFSYAQQIGSSPIYYSGNNVGIGTASPNSALDIWSGALHFVGGSGANFAVDGGYMAWNTTGNGGTGETNFINNIGGGSQGGFTFDNTTRSNVVTRLMTLWANGKVGIGTAAPAEMLTIRNANINYDSPTGVEKILFDSGAGGGAIGFEKETFNTGGLRFYTQYGWGSTLEKMRITASGYVGIGTTSPDQLLTVNGTIHAKQVNVDVNVPGPDYVFDKGYKLKTLRQVSQYIEANKHLPEIPTAKAMEQNGINVSEFNMKLLQKVEELTMYLIEKDNADKKKDSQLRAQQEEIDQLKQQMQLLIKTSKQTN